MIGYLVKLLLPGGPLSDQGKKVVFAATHKNIIDVLDMVGVLNLIKNYESVDEAAGSLKEGE